MVVKRKACFIGEFHVKSSRACHPYLMDFLKKFSSGRYHRDMKIVEMLTQGGSDSVAFLKHDKLMIEVGPAKYQIFSDNFCLKQPLVLKIFFDSRNSKMTSKLS